MRHLCIRAATAAAIVGLAACGGEERRDAGLTDRSYTVAVQRASFEPRQRLAQRNALIISVRNAGEQAIPNLTVTVRGFTDRAGGSRDADRGRDLWIVGRAPTRAGTAFDDTWAVGRVEPGRTATLRWDVTPVVAGTHKLTYEIAPATAGSGRVELSGGEEPRGSLTVRVSAAPSRARVDPRTGEVIRQE